MSAPPEHGARWARIPSRVFDMHDRGDLSLRELGELDFEMGQGRPGPFTFRLIGDGYAVGGARCRQLPLSNVVPGGFQGADAADLEVPADFQISDPSDLEVSTEPWRSGPAAIARVDSDV